MTTLNTITNQLIELKLTGMREAYSVRSTQARKEQLSNDQVLSILLQDEIDYRRSARIKRLLKAASFRQKACFQDFDLQNARGLDASTVKDLATSRFIDDGVNIVILGPTGVGKTYLATAIGNNACKAGHTVLFYRLNNLIEQLVLARAKANYLNILKRIASVDLLILDDFGIKPLEPQHFQDLYDVLDERGEEKATIITSQVPVENWGEIIADPVTCEAITDRLVAVAMCLVMTGDSYRPKRGVRHSLDKH